MRIRAATRGSPLARWQAEHVADLLTAAGADAVDLVIVETTGDLDRTTPLEQLGGQGVFVKEVQAAVLDGRADVAVHSAKDLPAATPEGLVLAAVPGRGDPRDALVGARLELLARIEDPDARRAVDAERGFLAELGAGCELPIAAHATVRPDGVVELTAALSSSDGDVLLVDARSGDDPEALGRAAARHLLDERGGSDLLGRA